MLELLRLLLLLLLLMINQSRPRSQRLRNLLSLLLPPHLFLRLLLSLLLREVFKPNSLNMVLSFNPLLPLSMLSRMITRLLRRLLPESSRLPKSLLPRERSQVETEPHLVLLSQPSSLMSLLLSLERTRDLFLPELPLARRSMPTSVPTTSKTLPMDVRSMLMPNLPNFLSLPRMTS